VTGARAARARLCEAGAVTSRLDIAGLTTRIVGPPDAPATVVLLHGFGAPGDDLVALANYFDAPARYVFPAAPLELGGLYGDSRAWWLLDLAKLEQELRSGVPRDRSDEIPEGLPNAREHLLRFLDQLQARYQIPDDKLVIGGFSQGAMLALDIALHRQTPPAGLVLMSTTWVAAKDWEPRFGSLAGVPIVMSHGRNDMLLPFSVSEALRDRLRTAGANVEWHQFVGGHEIPPAVLDAVGAFLRASR
jgi:phospholipase/carboxylesterase